MDFWGSTAGSMQGMQRPLQGGAEGWRQVVMGMVRGWSWEETRVLHIICNASSPGENFPFGLWQVGMEALAD